MPPDKYSAVWVSHSSMGDFMKCPRAYFLHNVYKNENGRKINLTNPHLALGVAVHNTLEGLLQYRLEDRFAQPLLATFEEHWKKVSGNMGGFKTAEQEEEAKARAKAMIERVDQNRGPLAKLAVKLKEHANGMPPNFYLSEEHNIILSGKIDWLEYVPKDNSVRVIDFKTGKNEEDKNSLQLPIYALLLNALQKRRVSGSAYWYIERDNEPKSVDLPDLATSYKRVLEVALKVKQARQNQEFACPRNGCFACQPFEKILAGEAQYVHFDASRNADVFMIS